MINKYEPIIPDVEDYTKHLQECPVVSTDLSLPYTVGYLSIFEGKIVFKHNMYWHFFHAHGIRHFEIPCGDWEKANWEEIFNDFPVGTIIKYVPEALLNIWNDLPNVSLDVSTDEGEWDYIYDIEKYQKLEMQKRMERRFRDLYIPVFEEISDVNCDEILEFNELAVEAIQKTHNDDFEMLDEDNKVMKYILKNQSLFPSLKGIIMRVDNKIVSFVVWDKLNDETCVALFNKTLHEYRGATETCINEMCRRLALTGCKYLNYTSDCNMPGLRHAKSMRQPIYMLKKYTVTIKEKHI